MENNLEKGGLTKIPAKTTVLAGKQLIGKCDSDNKVKIVDEICFTISTNCPSNKTSNKGMCIESSEERQLQVP